MPIVSIMFFVLDPPQPVVLSLHAMPQGVRWSDLEDDEAGSLTSDVCGTSLLMIFRTRASFRTRTSIRTSVVFSVSVSLMISVFTFAFLTLRGLSTSLST